jgi:hypothetical protein
MIILDFNGILIGQVAGATKEHGPDTDMSIIKNYFFGELLNIKKKFSEFGEVVVACDSPNSWRKQYYPYYKINRKTDRAKLPFDWDLCMAAITQIQDDLRGYFPYKVLKVESCEADDIVAVVCKHVTGFNDGLQRNSDPIMIVSADQDFLQLQTIKGVQQWSTNTKKLLVERNPDKFLFDKILKGDSGDGVVNILSADDAIANGVRQKPITAARIEKWTEHFVNTGGELHPELSIENYTRNKTLVDLLNCIPEELCSKIKQQFDEYQVPSKLKLQSFFISNRMKEFHSELQYF